MTRPPGYAAILLNRRRTGLLRASNRGTGAMEFLALKFDALNVFVLAAAYVDFHGRVRHRLLQQITDHSTLMAPYHVLMYLFSAVPNPPFLDRFPEQAVRSGLPDTAGRPAHRTMEPARLLRPEVSSDRRVALPPPYFTDNRSAAGPGVRLIFRVRAGRCHGRAGLRRGGSKPAVR